MRRASPATAASVPGTLTEQGRLFDLVGAPLDASITLHFAIYAAASGGAPLWQESQLVTLDEGYFSVDLGETTPFPASLWDGSTRYVGITVGSDPEMSPRQAAQSVPYALRAGDAVGDLHPTTVSVNGNLVIDASGAWVGPSSGLIGPQGPQGPIGPQGPAGPAGAQGIAGQDGAQGPAGTRTAAEVVQQLAQGVTEGQLNQPTALDVAAKLEGQRAARAARAEIAVSRRTRREDVGHTGQGDHVVDQRRLAKQAFNRRQGRFGADDATLAFETFQQRCLLAADVRAGALAHLDPEVAEEIAGRGDRTRHHGLADRERGADLARRERAAGSPECVQQGVDASHGIGIDLIAYIQHLNSDTE